MAFTAQEFADAYNDVNGNPTLHDVGAVLGISKKTVKNRAGIMRRTPGAPILIDHRQRGTAAPVVHHFASEEMPEPTVHATPVAGSRKRFILTAAQDETKIHEGFWNNLKAFANAIDAEIMVAGFTYSKAMHANTNKKYGSEKVRENEIRRQWHPDITPYLINNRIELGDKLVFCGEMNTLPTAVKPLSGFETYTGDKWGIFPHTKVQLKSVANAKHAISKQIMTTGAVTLPNYVLRKEGIKATFHHIIGAVVVELCGDGTFFCRHIQAEDDGAFYDLHMRVENGEVSYGNRVEALTYGDIHEEKLDPIVARSTWGYHTGSREIVKSWYNESLAYHLRPHKQFFHDLTDFAPRNHHNVNDPHFIFKTFQNGSDDVRAALAGGARFASVTRFEGTTSYIVQSNHDDALTTWLKSSQYDYRKDPKNAIFYLETQLGYYKWLATGQGEPPVFENVLRNLSDLEGVEFLNDDDSFLICGDIETAMHGHQGANGSRGSTAQYVKAGRKSNTAHTHSPEMLDGAAVAGVSAKTDMGYNKGMSSWTQAHICTYANGKRTILTMMGQRFFADQFA